MDTKKFNLTMNIIKFTIGAIGLVACLWVLFKNPGSDATELEKANFADTPQMNLAIYYTIVTIVIALASVLLFFLYQLVTNPKKTALSISGIIAALLIYLVFYFIGTSDTNESLLLLEKNHVSDSTLAGTNAGLITVYIGVAVAIVLAIAGPFLLGKYRK